MGLETKCLLVSHPRVPVALLPTPLHPLDRLRATLGPAAPQIYIKRDDLTGLALGGNKSRKLEYLLADARHRGCDTVITCGAAQSNHALQTAMAARKFGFEVRCVLYGAAPTPDRVTGNVLLHRWVGTPLRWVTMQDGETRREQALRRGLREEAEAARAAGRTPCVIPTGGSTAVGALGYVQAMVEIQQQIPPDRADTVRALFFASGSGGTHAGMVIGARITGFAGTIIGVEIDPIPPDATGVSPFHRAIVTLANETARLLGLSEDLQLRDIVLESAYAGPAYGVSTPEGEEAIRLLVRTEGILLDPVYTGKAFAALLGAIRAGHFRPDETVIFWHTGGVAGLFAGYHPPEA
ncbi:MAG: D-cysteine desulfhydrase family protein [Chloroherpetonaceae bacterium]|nr:D-cysteine desulfhydrase family protein [Chthonomonadaceae bacterium]MDW8206871.1 D-cysteine desulfhydrase family protein [Chloroherpetonaceae bacterium]